MKVIHDDETGGLGVIPLVVNWRINENCQIRDCKKRTNAIVILTANESPDNNPHHIGICEQHYSETNKSGKFHYTVDP